MSSSNNFFANLAFRPRPGQPNTTTNTTSSAAANMTLAFRPAPGNGPPTNTNTTAVAARDPAAAAAEPTAEGADGPMSQGEEDENEDDEEREEREAEEIDALLGSLERDFQAEERLRREEEEEEAAARSGQEEEARFRSSSSQAQIREGIAHRREHWRSLGRHEQQLSPPRGGRGRQCTAGALTGVAGSKQTFLFFNFRLSMDQTNL